MVAFLALILTDSRYHWHGSGQMEFGLIPSAIRTILRCGKGNLSLAARPKHHSGPSRNNATLLRLWLLRLILCVNFVNIWLQANESTPTRLFSMEIDRL